MFAYLAVQDSCCNLTALSNRFHGFHSGPHIRMQLVQLLGDTIQALIGLLLVGSYLLEQAYNGCQACQDFACI